MIPLDEKIESYACHLHSDFQILKNSKINVTWQTYGDLRITKNHILHRLHV